MTIDGPGEYMTKDGKVAIVQGPFNEGWDGWAPGKLAYTYWGPNGEHNLYAQHSNWPELSLVKRIDNDTLP